MTQFFYDVCFKHQIFRQTPTELVPNTKWANLPQNHNLVVGENINHKKQEVYFLTEVDCDICKGVSNDTEYEAVG